MRVESKNRFLPFVAVITFLSLIYVVSYHSYQFINTNVSPTAVRISSSTSNLTLSSVPKEDDQLVEHHDHHRHDPIAGHPDPNDAKYFFGNVTVIFTSCGRWDELSASIESFEAMNTYPYINDRIVIDDCPDVTGFDRMHEEYNTKYGYKFYHTSTPLPSSSPNDPRLRKPNYRSIRSLYEAMVNHTSDETEWIFASEDDWYFYRASFIEYSFAIYNHSAYHRHRALYSQLKYKYITFLLLRNQQFYPPPLDLREFCGGPYRSIQQSRADDMFMFMDHTYFHGQILKYTVAQSKDCYAHYTANPGLKQKSSLIPMMANCLNKTTGVGSYERCVGCQYGMHQFALASMRGNGFVGHLGHSGRHVNIKQVEGQNKNGGAEIDMREINQLIPLNDGWILNQSVCKYIPPDNYTGVRPQYID